MKRTALSLAVFVLVTGLAAGGAAAVTNAELGTALPSLPAATSDTATQGANGAIRAALGIPEPVGMTAVEYSKVIAESVASRGLDPGAEGGSGTIASSGGVANFMGSSAPLSAAIATSVGGTGVILLGDWDGREDLTADIQGFADDVATKVSGAGTYTLTRTAVSAHSIANGFNENVFYYGDNFGNVYIGYSNSLTNPSPLPAANVLVLNLPTMLNAFGTLNSDSHIVVTGLAVSPVADLSSFGHVNGSYTAPFDGRTGEVVYVAFWDAGGGFRTGYPNRPIHSGILAFPVADVVSPAVAPPGVQSQAGFPVTVGGTFGVVYSVYANLAGVAVDDDGNAYFQQVDLTRLAGANIVKITDTGTDQDRSPATNGIMTLTTLNPTDGKYGIASGPSPSQVNTFTNYSGTAKLFGNVVSLATGPGNVLYAAVSATTSGFFKNLPTIGSTPALILTMADATGAFDTCTGSAPGERGILKIADGFADRQYGTRTTPGVNNFRAFALGAGPDKRIPTSPLLKAVFGTAASTLKLDFVVDYGIYSGLTVDELGAVYLVSGGTPAGIGLNQSPTRGEVLLFPDQDPADRRADRIDLRKNTLPNPPDLTSNKGDGDSDRFDHLFWMAPMDPMTFRPMAVSGLSRGFLRYLNRTAPNAITNLPNGTIQGDDTSSGPIDFNAFDLSGQVAGGYEYYTTTGDDAPAGGGFEFVLGGLCTAPSTSFYLNANGFVTFGSGVNDYSPTPEEFVTGPARIGVWTDLYLPSRTGMLALNTFPVQAVGFAGINTFMARYINVPDIYTFTCGSSNTFSIALWDDGVGADENAAPGTVEGPTAFRFRRVGTRNVGSRPRPDKSGWFTMRFGRMDLLGASSTPGRAVITGYSVGARPLPAPAERNLSAVVPTSYVGTGAEPTIYELFNSGTIPPAADPDFDLRFEGNDGAKAKPAGQPDANRDALRFKGRSCQ